MADLFISYSRRDASFVGKIAGQLAASGISYWMDTAGIEGGEQWKTEIARAIDDAKWCLLVLSPQSMASRQIAAEVNMAFDKGRPIVPVLHEECEINTELAYALAGTNHIDFTGPFQDGMTKLHRALGSTAPGRRMGSMVLDDNESDGRTIGRGLGFPLRPGRTGGIAMLDRGEAIDDAIRMVLWTAPGERVGRPEYGCTIRDLTFERFDRTTMEAMAGRVREAVNRWEPRADDVAVHVDTQDRAIGSGFREIDVQVAYRVRGTQERREFTTRFWLG